MIFFCKTENISPTVTYSDKASINDSSKSINKDRDLSNNNLLTDERKSVTILGGSLLNGINEKGLSHKVSSLRSLINLEQPVKEIWRKSMT